METNETELLTPVFWNIRGSPFIQRTRLKEESHALVREWCLHLKGIVGLLNVHIRHGIRSFPFTVYCQKADYHIVYPKHRRPFISESLLWVGTVLKEMPSLSRALTNVPLSLSNIRDHLFFGIGSFCCRGQFGEATFTKLSCPASSTSSGSTVINSTDINFGKSRVDVVHKTPLWSTSIEERRKWKLVLCSNVSSTSNVCT